MGTRCGLTTGLFSRSVCCHWVGANLLPLATAGDRLSGRKLDAEKLWRDFFSDPCQWWDNRLEKVNPKYPDFKHKLKRQSLWVDNYLTPPWVESELAAMAPGTFDSDIFSWNVRLRRHAKAGDFKTVLDLFKQMQREGMIPDKFTFVPVLNACSGLLALEEGRRIHLQILRSGIECNVFVGSCLVDMYARCGKIENARRVFNKMPKKDVVAWGVLILGYVKCGQGQEALRVSQQMQQEGIDLDPVTFVGVLNACAALGSLEEGRHAHKQIIDKGYESNIYVASSLVDMYAKCGSIEDARKVFNKMPARNMVSWSAMLGGYCQYGYVKEALEHFGRMCQEVEVNATSFVSLLSACSHSGLVDEGMCSFESMRSHFNISPTSEHYACVIDLLGRAGHLHEAEDLIKNIPFEPDAALWTSLLGACTMHGNLEIGERVAKQVLVLDPLNSAGYVLLSNIYATASKMNRVQAVCC